MGWDDDEPWPWEEEVRAQRQLIAKSPWGKKHPEEFTAAERGEEATPPEEPTEP
jgi:hypothetical protein